METVYRTTDVYLDAWIELQTEQKSALVNDAGLFIFVRPLDAAVLEAVESYNKGAVRYALVVKRRRGELLNAKNGRI